MSYERNGHAPAPAKPAAGSRTVPADESVEWEVIGGLLIRWDLILDVRADGLTAECFYQPPAAAAYTAMMALDDADVAGRPSPSEVVAAEVRLGLIRADQAEGHQRVLDGLEQRVPGTERSVRTGTARLVDLTSRRRLLSVAAEVAELARDRSRSVAEVQAAVEALLLDRPAAGLAGPVPLGEVARKAVDYLENPDDNEAVIHWPWETLDESVPWMRPGQLVLVGARPGVGKTAFAVNLAHGVAERGKPVLFVSLEMTEEELGARLLAGLAQVDLGQALRGKLDEFDRAAVIGTARTLDGVPLLIDTTPAMTLAQIGSAARRVRRDHKRLGMVVIDYCELVRSDGDGRETEERRVGRIARGAKELARQLGCVVVLLSQLSRATENRADRRPTLADLRYSGDLEAAADVVIGLYRDELYDEDTEDRGIGEVIVLKARNGQPGRHRLAYIGRWARWAELMEPDRSLPPAGDGFSNVPF